MPLVPHPGARSTGPIAVATAPRKAKGTGLARGQGLLPPAGKKPSASGPFKEGGRSRSCPKGSLDGWAQVPESRAFPEGTVSARP